MTNRQTEENKRWGVITGGSRGIGQAIALELADQGVNIWILYLQDDKSADATVEIIRKRGVRAERTSADVADPSQVDAAFSGIMKATDRVDVLVNCAGIAQDHTLEKLSVEEWNRVLSVNLSGAFHCSKAVLRNMKNRNYGRIINISSVIGQTGNIGQANYSSSKAGLIGFTKSLALETAKYDITVNAICPGFIHTGMIEKIPVDVREGIRQKIPKQRFGTPHEIARMAAFLSAPESAYITGQSININGGLYL